MGNCVGKRNYRYFLTFLLLTIFNLVSCLAFTTWLLAVLTIEAQQEGHTGFDGFIQAALQYPDGVLLDVFLFIIFFSVAGLVSYHVYISVLGRTTNEDVRALKHYFFMLFQIKRTFGETGFNPYGGSYLRNFFSRICPPMFPSFVSHRTSSGIKQKANTDETREHDSLLAEYNV